MIKVNGEKKTPAQLIRDILKKHLAEAIQEAYSFEEYVDDPEKLTDVEKDKIIKTMQHQMEDIRRKAKINKNDLPFLWEL